ncbi:MAG: hypothetical protein ABW003_00420 [Microvirga sp.]
MRLPALLASFLMLAAGHAAAKECRMPDLPPGVQVRVPPECQGVVKQRTENDRVKAAPGAIDLGYGTTVRIGGRVRAETTVRR